MSYSKSFNVFGKTIEFSGNLYYGCITGGVELDFDEGRFKVIPPMVGLGWDFGVDID